MGFALFIGTGVLTPSSLASPKFEFAKFHKHFHSNAIADCPTDIRAKAELFLGFQYPQEIAGVSLIQFLRQALSARKGIDLPVLELRLATMDWMKRLGMDSSFVDRYLNEGFSVDEKNRNEIMQMAILEPDLAVLDEQLELNGYESSHLLADAARMTKRMGSRHQS